MDEDFMDEVIQLKSGQWIEKNLYGYLHNKIRYLVMQEKMLYRDTGKSVNKIIDEVLNDIRDFREIVTAETEDGSVITYARFTNILPQDYVEFYD